MAFLTMSMFSEILQMDTDVSVLLPENRKGGIDPLRPDHKYPVIYCLHGHGDDHTAWIRKSNIETVARQYNVIVVMPTVQRGYYIDSDNGYQYYTYITKELPIKIANFFPASLRRGDQYLMGNSMGGFGALRIGLANPEHYAGIYALSPALPQSFTGIKNEFTRGIDMLFGPTEELVKSDNNLLNLADQLNQYEGNRPLIYACCGTEDMLVWNGFESLDQHIKAHDGNLDYHSYTTPGNHDWDFWNPQIKKAFEIFGFEKK